VSAGTTADPLGFGLAVGQITKPQTGLFWYYQGETLGYRVVYAYFPTTGAIFTVGVNSQPYTSAAGTDDEILLLLESVYATLEAAGKV
jgi:D-alanyl-D-alanine carboxypeptidase